MPAGRPTKYDPSICERVVAMGKYGASKAEMALELDIDYTTFLAWQDKHEEFSKAVKRAEQNSKGWWERLGRQSANGEVDGFNATSFIFNMKNRFKDDWKDRHDLNHGSEDGSMTPKPALDVSKLSTEALAEIMAASDNEPDRS